MRIFRVCIEAFRFNTNWTGVVRHTAVSSFAVPPLVVNTARPICGSLVRLLNILAASFQIRQDNPIRFSGFAQEAEKDVVLIFFSLVTV